MKFSKYDIVIVGSGLSGLYLANKLALKNNFNDGILLVTKEELFSGSSALAQGGIVSVIPELNKQDSVESHIKDTITAGCGLNDLSAVKFTSEFSATIAQELIAMGVEFDRNDKHALNFTLEGAHSCPRILHSKGDSTGRVIEETLCNNLIKQNNVEFYNHTMAVELLVDSDEICRGIVLYNYQKGIFETVYSNNVILATGGVGQIFKSTTNPLVSTADGIALAHRAGAEIENMEFIQFHPTALYSKDKDTMPLVSESARGEGAKLIDLNGDYFAKNYHHQGDLAPRDVVARAINQQIDENGFDYVNLDISQIGIEKFKQRFPTITALCNENNVNIDTGLIPVVPAEHYCMGGIKTDLSARTTIENLYAVGECASTGLHGANRLASNSLLECAVFAHNLALKLIKNAPLPPKRTDEKIKQIIDKYSELDTISQYDENIKELLNSLKNSMTKNSGIIRTEKSLKQALIDIDEITFNLINSNFDISRQKFELQNALCVAKIIVESALKRKNSIGAHFRADYPHTIENINTTEEIKENGKILVK